MDATGDDTPTSEVPIVVPEPEITSEAMFLVEPPKQFRRTFSSPLPHASQDPEPEDGDITPIAQSPVSPSVPRIIGAGGAEMSAKAKSASLPRNLSVTPPGTGQRPVSPRNGFRRPNLGPGAAGGNSLSRRKFKGPKLNNLVLKPVPAAQSPAARPLSEVLVSQGGMGKITLGGRELACGERDVEDLRQDLGSGAYGFVKKMQHRETGLVMAVKIIRDNTSDASARKALLKDLEIIRNSDCKSIVQYYGYNFTEGAIWIFMELMQASLESMYGNVARAGAQIPEKVLGRIAVSVLDALAYLKMRKGVMHRDVKPSNVLIGFDGAVKLCDFGISKSLEQYESFSKTAVGCDRYLPPERLNPLTSKDSYDTRSDIWAYGLTLVELAHLKYPYPTANPYMCSCAIVEGPPPQLPDDFSPPFRAMVSMCLKKDRDDRPKYYRPSKNSPDNGSLMDNPFITVARSFQVDLAQWYADYHR